MNKIWFDSQSPQKHANDAEHAITESATTLEKTVSRSDLDAIPKRPPSAALPSNNRNRPPSDDVSRRKPTDNTDTIVSQPGTYKARPIPAMPLPDTEVIPKDPDQDSPNIYVSTYLGTIKTNRLKTW